MDNELFAYVPAESLVLGGGAPVYQRETKRPDYLDEINKFDINNISEPENYVDVAHSLLKNLNIASKRWVIEQYDTMVGTKNMSTNVPSDAAVVNVKGTNKALVLTTDCNSRYVYADPLKGTEIAVAEAARNIVCSGGEPLAITNCLNFGNPYNPEVYWQFVGAIKGMSNACKKFNTPVTGGNVSFYNQSSNANITEPIYPTPVIGMLGIINDKSKRMSLDFKNEGDLIYLIGEPKNDISMSEYLYNYLNIKLSPAPIFDLDEEYKVQNAVKLLIQNDLILSAHDVSEGGLFIALFESAMPRELGFEIKTVDNIRKDAFLFGESQSRVVVSVSPDKKKHFEEKLKENLVYFIELGKVTSQNMYIDKVDFGNVAYQKIFYNNSLAEIMK
jgi:phosphoribosylformylglycinamidine synthase